MDWMAWAKYGLNALVAGAGGYAMGGWPAAITAVAGVVAGLVQTPPHKQ